MDKITLTEAERERYDIIRSCIDGDIGNKEASERLGLSMRHVQKIKRAVRKRGMKGIRHGLCSARAHNATDAAAVKSIIAFLKQKKHQDFGPTFAKEKLEKLGFAIGTETLRSLMIKENLWKPRKRRGPQIHREWRERMGSFGELVQFDGSYHDWLENDGEGCLLAAIDDATGKIIKAEFEDNEGVHAVFRFWKAYVETHGRPVAIYLDKFSTYKINHKNAADNEEMMTQFQRAMEELDIRVICAHSPEAKGRVERLFGTLQDRLVKEMRLADIRNTIDANIFLKDTYIPDHNLRFSVQARTSIDMHRPLTDAMRKNLTSIFSVQSDRRVNNDYTVQFKTKWYQLDATQQTTVYKRDRVVIEEWLDGSIHIRLKQTYLAYTNLPERPKRVKVRVTALTRQKPTNIPSKNHPWRSNFNFGKNGGNA